ncbi:pyrroline-5-carboxylate reductase [Sphingomonas guangdongensis]|uniref:Pyrroline-5-carboxylate reductase n=1 Tax=Sphingomonas guangdongensis TaxID=1141890 RepID=A0A285Q9K4_9SPHN|nr:pyrroline-5-carboxylate reductase dimerization domain-containing protein [Sphingomonas guangdongensis]SOB78511.1 pyrroline-5-carboxylate reductase [Sphingomonas guangdongensis]
MSDLLDGRLLMVGAGAMGGAMLARWLDIGLVPEQVTVVSPSGRAMPPGVAVVPAIPAEPFDTVLLALKPQQLPQLAATPLAVARPALLLSILAGVREEALAAACPAAAIVRAMPNLPVRLGKGVVALTARTADDAARTAAGRLMAPLGLVEWVDEGSFDLVTALAGSGPAFLYRFIDALAAAAADLGLSADQAGRLALATVGGAAALAAAADATPGDLANQVASKGGSTRAGLDVLDDEQALRTLLRATLAAAERRNGELAAINSQ